DSEKSNYTVITKVLKQVESFVEKERKLGNINEKIEIEKSYGYISEQSEGLILKLREYEETDLDYNEIKKYLAEQNIKYSIVSQSYSRSETGGSGDINELFLFLANVTISGAAWDMVKVGLKQILGMPKQGNYRIIENNRFKRVRKIVADRSRIEEEKLVLNDFQTNLETIQMIFKTE